MAFKTNVMIKQEMEAFFRFKMECLNRNPAYAKDYLRIEQLECDLDRLALAMMERDENFSEDEDDLDDDYDKAEEEYSTLLRKYNIKKYPAPRPHDSNGWRTLQASSPAVVLQINDPYWSGPVYGLSGKRHYQTFRVDMSRNKKAILHEISDQIDKIKAKTKKEGSAQGKRDQNPHLSNYKRYFAVWDMVQSGNKKLTYKLIALKLQGQGFYEEQTLEQAEALARKDFILACKLIGIAEKIYKRSKSDYIKPIIGLPEAQKHKKEIEEWEERLRVDGLGLNEVLYKGSTRVLAYNKDGHIRRRLKSEERQESTKEEDSS